MINEINLTAEFLIKHDFGRADIGIVLGTGLGNLTGHIKIIQQMDYSTIPGFPLATVESHKGKLIYGELCGKKVIAMQGRFHFYEGYSMQQITFPVRVLRTLGIGRLLLSNAAGAINLSFKKGSLMLIRDHINLLPDNPLRGTNFDALGPRFPDMSAPYSAQLNEILLDSATQKNIVLNAGVYASVPGPNLETAAEYRYLKTIGADAVGMSTVPEVIVANHMGLPCSAISVITDECDPDHLKPVSISEILEVAALAEAKLIDLLLASIPKM